MKKKSVTFERLPIVQEFPPNWEKIKATFPLDSAEVIMTYDGVIYNPFKLGLRDDLLFHELVHSEQQKSWLINHKGKTIDDWWETYASNKEYRVDTETWAYGKQVKYIRQTQGEQRAVQAMKSFAQYLSGPVYGNAITELVAFEKIRKISRQ